jgi:hypothetical protein
MKRAQSEGKELIFRAEPRLALLVIHEVFFEGD